MPEPIRLTPLEVERWGARRPDVAAGDCWPVLTWLAREVGGATLGAHEGAATLVFDLPGGEQVVWDEVEGLLNFEPVGLLMLGAMQTAGAAAATVDLGSDLGEVAESLTGRPAATVRLAADIISQLRRVLGSPNVGEAGPHLSSPLHLTGGPMGRGGVEALAAALGEMVRNPAAYGGDGAKYLAVAAATLLAAADRLWPG